jgi:hypothetical protein
MEVHVKPGAVQDHGYETDVLGRWTGTFGPSEATGPRSKCDPGKCRQRDQADNDELNQRGVHTLREVSTNTVVTRQVPHSFTLENCIERDERQGC